MDGLLLTGGSDIAPEFLRQEIVDPSAIDKDVDVERDRWEFAAVQDALSRGTDPGHLQGSPSFECCARRHTQARYSRTQIARNERRDVQLLRNDRGAKHRFGK